MNRLLFVFALAICMSCHAQPPSKETVGPENGALVIVGGGSMPQDIIDAFLELAGGPDAPILIVPTAAGAPSYDENIGDVQGFRAAGATNVSILHTYDRVVANSDQFLQKIRDARGIWFGGGRQWRLVDAYKGTKTEIEFQNVLKRGGVIGGSSAGATIQGSYLARGDTRNNQIMMGDHKEGFGYLTNVAIDQHTLARNRQFDMFDILQAHPELLGISIDEGTAIVVKQDTFVVLGKSYVLIYDGTFWSREGSELKTLPPPNQRFYFLKKGDHYNLKDRVVIH